MEMTPGYKRTNAGTLPEDWDVCQLRALAMKSSPIAYGVLKPGKYFSNGIPLLQINDVIHGQIKVDELHRIGTNLDAQYSRTRLAEGDIVISLIGTVGRVARIPAMLAGANLHRNLARIRVSSQSHSGFVFHYLKSERTQRSIKLTTFGSSQALFNLYDLRALLVAVPLFPEQQAIAQILDDMDTLIESLEQLIAKKRQSKQGAMQELLTGKKRLPGFTDEWQQRRFGDIANPRKERVDPHLTGPQEFCVELEHIDQGTGRLVGHTETSEGSSLKSVFQKDDVLFGKLRAYLRKFWLATRQGVCSTEIWVLVAKRPLLTPQFLFQLVTTDRFIEAASSAYGTHMPRSDWSVVKNYEIALPPLPEQTAIASILSDMDAEISALEEKLAKSRMVQEGMRQDLLTGKTRLI
jgi:type I restriction enzyme S subunit